MSPQTASTPKTILVVDDDTSVLELVRDVLKRYSYEIQQADTVEGAIRSVQDRGPIDLLLLDAVMPVMSGPELADILLFLRPDMKVLFITGLDSLAIRLAFDQPCGCLQKPFTAGFLVAKVREMLGESGENTSDRVTSALDSS